MTIIQGFNQYLNCYKEVIPNKYVNIFIFMIKVFNCMTSSLKTACNIVFEENVSVGSVTYSVKSNTSTREASYSVYINWISV